MSDGILLPPKCETDDALHEWLRVNLEIDVPRKPVCANHNAPFDYVRGAYFEPSHDVVVWAPRGGGKTRLAAAATLLDLLHKPGTAVRILGGSLDQSLRIWEHLLPDLERLVPEHIIGKPGAARKVKLKNGSNAAILTQSQRAVRGIRVQKLRCDEVELFKPPIWEAAQLVTRSLEGVTGTIEAISTLHAPYGLMSKIVESAQASGIAVIRWCILEVLERCPPQRPCETCALWDECLGIAKTQCHGFLRIDDAIAMKRRVSSETWNAEMLCRKPAVRGCVFPAFDETVHVTCESPPDARLFLGIDFGFSAPFVCLWIRCDDAGKTHVIDEYQQPQRTVSEHVEQIKSRRWGDVIRVSCDPAGGARNEQTAASSKDVLKESGFVVRSRRSQIVDGLEMIRTALRPAMGEPRLFIHPRCKNLIRAMQSYRYPEGGGEIPLKDGEHDHLIDALRYHFVNHQTRDTTSRSY